MAGEEISIPDYPFLQNFTQKQNELKRAIAKAETRDREIQIEAQRGDRLAAESGDLAALSNVSAERARLKREIDQIYAEQKGLEHQLDQSRDEMRQWLENFGGWIYQRRELIRELGKAPAVGDPPDTMRTHSVGESPRVRSRAEVLEELLEVVAKLARFSGDPKLATEWAAMKKQIADSLPYVSLTTDYVRLGTGKIISEAEFNQLAVEGGSDSLKGTTSSPYRKGARVDRAEAAQLGLV